MTALPSAISLPSGLPWWTYLLVALTCLGVYICRMLLLYKIGSKALDKVSQDRVPEVVNSLTGYRGRSPVAEKSPGSTRRVGRQPVGGQLEQAPKAPAPGAVRRSTRARSEGDPRGSGPDPTA